jgi:hypothetical protein
MAIITIVKKKEKKKTEKTKPKQTKADGVESRENKPSNQTAGDESKRRQHQQGRQF